MYKLDFSDLHENGYRINQLRLMYSDKFRGANFKKNAEHFSSNDDLAGERDLFTEYFIENWDLNMEINNGWAGHKLERGN